MFSMLYLQCPSTYNVIFKSLIKVTRYTITLIFISFNLLSVSENTIKQAYVIFLQSADSVEQCNPFPVISQNFVIYVSLKCVE
jgi:hypothetical protein